MPVAGIIACVLIVLTAGCTGVEREVPRESREAGAAHDVAVSLAPATPRATASAEPLRAGAPKRETAESAAAAAPSVGPGAAKSARPRVAKTESPGVKAPAGPSATRAAPARAVQPAKTESRPDISKQEAPSPLDLALLKTRLKNTKAIGVMTKIALKNQVDELLNQFRASYQGQLNPTRAELRKSFDLLLLKVLALLQEGDPSLASAIVASRETIWSVLSDPVKFASFATL